MSKDAGEVFTNPGRGRKRSIGVRVSVGNDDCPHISISHEVAERFGISPGSRLTLSRVAGGNFELIHHPDGYKVAPNKQRGNLLYVKIGVLICRRAASAEVTDSSIVFPARIFLKRPEMPPTKTKVRRRRLPEWTLELDSRLGMETDTDIAKDMGVSIDAVRNRRIALRIKRYSRSKTKRDNTP